MNESISASSLEEDLVQKTAPMAVLANFILDGLSFSSMRNREDEVAEAHDTTFDWLFQYNLDEGEQNGLGIQFAKWLQSDELGNIYWGTYLIRQVLIRDNLMLYMVISHRQAWRRKVNVNAICG